MVWFIFHRLFVTYYSKMITICRLILNQSEFKPEKKRKIMNPLKLKMILHPCRTHLLFSLNWTENCKYIQSYNYRYYTRRESEFCFLSNWKEYDRTQKFSFPLWTKRNSVWFIIKVVRTKEGKSFSSTVMHLPVACFLALFCLLFFSPLLRAKKPRNIRHSTHR